MKRMMTLALVMMLALGMMSAAVAEEAAQPAEVTEATQPTGLEAALALKLENGQTFEELLIAQGNLDAFKAANPGLQLRIIQAFLTLDKLTAADVKALLTTLAGERAQNLRQNWQDGGMRGMNQRMQGRGKGKMAQQFRGRRMQDCPCLNTPDTAPGPTEEAVPGN